jgi:uncharacterized Zn finger protein (UPF0148 family)
MKQLVCEMCGGTDLVKDGGVFVCQTCGCKYTVEEAKKMMIEGTVDVQGTVKVDNSAFVEKYLANARRAKEKEDWEETEKYYNMVEQNDPDNIEAIFYSSYGKAKQTLTDGDIYKRQATFKVLKNCISVIDDHYKEERREENKEAIISMGIDLGKMIMSDFVFTEWKNGYGIVTKTNKGETYVLFASLLDGFKESIDNIQKIDDQPYLHKSLITLFTTAKLVDWLNKKTMSDLMDKWITEEKDELDAIRQKLKDKYWEEHAEEKSMLDSEKLSLEKQVADLKKQIETLPEYINAENLQKQIAEWKDEKYRLGILSVKKKKELQEQIDEMSNSLSEALKAKENIVRPFNESIEKLQGRISEIDAEFLKER